MMGRRLFVLGVTLVWLGALALIGKAAVDRLSVQPWGNGLGDRLSPEVVGATEVGQRFTAPLPGLYRIDVMVESATGAVSRPLLFHLRTDPAAATDLHKLTISPGNLEPDRPLSVEFEPIRTSQGETYYFYLESPESVPAESVAVRYSPDAVLEGASAYVDGRPVAGNLEFRTFYTLRTRDKVDLLLTRMAEGRPYLLGKKGFYVGLAAVYALVLSVFLWLVGKAVWDSERP
jgi:hypothetical protein